MATTDEPDVMEQVMRIAAGVLVKLMRTPEGAEQCAEHLRDQGWSGSASPSAW